MKRLLCALACLLHTPGAHAEWRGYVSAELLGFQEAPRDARQHDAYASLAFEPEYFREWNRRDDLFTFKPYFLVDSHDDNRTHADIRELSWIHVARDWETNIGISKVYWGVTEAVHLVDIINQTDLVVNEDGEDKLGQPMAKLTLIRDYGVVDLFVLPGFRERTFPDIEGRPRFGIPVNDDVLYESGAEELHTDFAVRWSHSIGEFDIGVAHFAGTAREPRFVVLPADFTPPSTIAKVTPLYEIINQTSLDLQAIFGGWLLKLEAIVRSGQGKRVRAVAGGYEYTFVGVNDSQIDIGIITEYLYDSRSDDINLGAALAGQPFSTSPFQNDLVLGARFTLNDAASSELLASMIVDLDGGGQSYNLEASRRFGDSWKLSLEARGVMNIPANNVLSGFEDDNRFRLELARYF
ncbi:MAG: hypothetical protein HKP57_08570 [Halobacteria archaeon]|nr:hypothetical protein [Halobacteria archaeon]